MGCWGERGIDVEEDFLGQKVLQLMDVLGR